MKCTKQRIRQMKIGIGSLVALGMAFFLIWINLTDVSENEMPEVIYFRDFTLPTMEGNYFGTTDFADYDRIVVNVWEPYCTSCITEMPDLDVLAKAYRKKGLLLVGLQGNAAIYPEDVQKSRQQVFELGISYPVLLADERYTKEVLPILHGAFPGTFLLDAQGNVIDFVQGSKTKEGWDSYFAAALNGVHNREKTNE